MRAGGALPHRQERNVSYGVLTAGLACLIALFLLVAASPAFGVESKFNVTHLYNSAHSLTGGCEVSADDPVADPACGESPVGALPPEGPLAQPTGVAVDSYGDQYVVNNTSSNTSQNDFISDLDIFDPTGHYIGGFNINDHFSEGFSSVGWTKAIAVDSTGHLYVATETRASSNSLISVVRYDPTTFNPQAGEIAYGSQPVMVLQSADRKIAVNPLNDHLYIRLSGNVSEYGPPTDGVPNQKLTESIGQGVLHPGGFTAPVAVDGKGHKLYVADDTGSGEIVIDVFDAVAPYGLLSRFDGSTTPPGKLDTKGFAASEMSMTVDERSGDLFFSYKKRIFELQPDATYVNTIPSAKDPKISGEEANSAAPVQLGYDNSSQSTNQGFLYVPSGAAIGHLYAFESIAVFPPEVKSVSVSGVSEDEAILHATVNPKGEAGHYVFEYTTQADFAESGFANGQLAREGDIALSSEGVALSAAITGLSSGTAYRFRVRAENQCEQGGCTGEAQGSFVTFANYAQSGTCANQALRSGNSASLPDCRAYELVSPADTGGRAPFAPRESQFGIWTSSPDGSSLTFNGDGGAFPGQDTPGGYNTDDYVSRRGADGWVTEAVGLLGRHSASQVPLGISPDHTFTAIFAKAAGNLEGELSSPGDESTYLRYPDGSIHLIGEGSIAQDHGAQPRYISAGGGHIIFATVNLFPFIALQIEPDAPPTGTAAIYDRTADGVTHVVSLLPDEITPAAGQHASYLGASTDGSTVAFEVGNSGGPLYLRQDNAETLEVPEAFSGHVTGCEAGALIASELADGVPSYEWLLDGVPIPGASSATYTPDSSQAGSVLQCVVRLQNPEGTSIAASRPLVIDESRSVGPPTRATAVGALADEPAIGQTIDCDPGSWLYDPSFSYQWYRDGIAIGGATTSAYEVQASDARKLIQCAVAGSVNGTTTLAFSRPTEPAPPKPPKPTVSPSISNTTHPGAPPVVGDELHCDEGTWADSPSFTYQWYRDGLPISSATAAAYTVTAEDEDHALQCEVEATNADGAWTQASAAVAVSPLSIDALPQGGATLEGIRAVGSTLICNHGTWLGSPGFTYEWLRNGLPIAGAGSSTYTLVAADREAVVQCALTASNAGGAVRSLDAVFVNQKPNVRAVVANPVFAGLSAGGRYLFYLQGGDLYRYDTQAEGGEGLTNGANPTPAYVSADGSTAYFVSKAVLTSEAGPRGTGAMNGQYNLYLARGGEVRFIGTVTNADVEGRLFPGLGKTSEDPVGGFDEWLNGINASGFLPVRSSADGGALLFVSHADLTPFESGGKAQVYRYDASQRTLACLSCDPTGQAPGSDADLLSPGEMQSIQGVAPSSTYSIVPNLSRDGKRAFFESRERLVSADEDALTDVYEWEEQGKGSCTAPGGCLFLITSGQSGQNDYLYGASESGDDVFVYTADLLNGEDTEDAPSIFDARVGGGFPPLQAAAGECQGEACQPAAVAPNDLTPASSSFEGAGNAKPEGKTRCPKGKRSVHRGGKRRCLPRHRKQHKRHYRKKQAKTKGRTGR